MEDLTDEGGVFKRVAKGGVGNAIPEGSTVRIHYNGYLEYSDEPYDSTRLRNKPLTLHLGTGGAIPGLEIGVSTMKKGELAHILVKPEYAFGKMGCPPRIPPEATILFEVEVLSFHDQQAAEGYEAMPKEKKEKLDLKELIDVANSERESGNDYFQRNIFGKAAQCYTKGIGVLETARLKDEEEEREWSDALMKLHLNMALCALRQKKPKLCIVHCRRALELDQHNVKAVFRLGQAYSIMGEWECSKRHLLRAAKLAPKNLEIRQELANLNRSVIINS
jgi:FK506-binding protein 6